MKNKPFTICGHMIKPGERTTFNMPAACLYTQTPITIPIHVINGLSAGPKLLIIAAIHGDEINGVEIIRRLLHYSFLNKLCGTLIAIPVANVFGFVGLSRYLQDRRDLNREFPGSNKGSLGAQIAFMLKNEILSQCTHGIDLHTGNLRSENLPHLRANISIQGSLEIARAFNVPVIIDAKTRDGSIRQAATKLQIPFLVYEGGEALRFNEIPIRIGIRGILNVMQFIKMLKLSRITKQKKIKGRIAKRSSWSRAPESGIVYSYIKLGSDVEKGEKLGIIADPFSQKETEIISPLAGIVIGKNTIPLVNKGDALFHVAHLKGREEVVEQLNQLHADLIEDPFSYK